MANISKITTSITKKEINQATSYMKGIVAHTNGNINKYFLKIKNPEPIWESYAIRKEEFLKTLSNNGISNDILKQIKNSKNIGELGMAISTFQADFFKIEIFPIIKQFKPNKAHPLHLEQDIYAKQNLMNNCMRYLHALFSVPSTDPKVAAIEKILSEKFGIRALLGNDPVEAVKALQAVQTAKAKGIKIPEEIIVSEFTYGGAQNLRNADGSSTILYPTTTSQQVRKLLKPQTTQKIQDIIKKWKDFCQFKENFSTNNPIHMEMHEIMHQTHSPLYAFKTKKIPEKFMPTVRKLSAYSAVNTNRTHEVYTELATKKVLEGLDPNEAELFKFLGGDI